MPRFTKPSPVRGFSIIEVMIAASILLFGVVAIAALFPTHLRQNQRAVDTSMAAYLAQMKVEEIRRDNQTGAPNLRDEIAAMPGPGNAETFTLAPRFAYAFSGVSILDPDNNPGTARVIVRYDRDFKPSENVLYELQF